jgi:GT2 family glycosyltransferase
MIEIVSATRLSEADFSTSPLGVSLRRIAADKRLVPRIAYGNSRGLAAVYNERIADSTQDLLLFVHDDVWLEDFYFTDRLLEGLKQFDIVGLAGNTRLAPGHESWAHVPGTRRLDLPHLRGAIAHGNAPLGKVGFFGPIIGECELLDGVFLAAHRRRLIETGVRFDERFAFHFYDLDFCRSARTQKLRLGTWPISVTHRSTGNSDSDAWRAGLTAYRAKWNP